MMMFSREVKIEKRLLAVLPSSNYIYQKMLGGFTATLDEEHRLLYHFDLVVGKGDKTALKEKIGKVLTKKSPFDLVFSIGTGATYAVLNIQQEQKLKTPHIFCAARVSAMNSSLPMTGFIGEARDYSFQVNYLLDIIAEKPRHVVILSTLFSVPDEVVALKNELKKHAIEVVDVVIDHLGQNPLKPLLSIPLEKTDLIMVPRDTMGLSIIKEIAEFCNHKKIPLYTSDIESVLSGAAIGFGSPEELHGKMAAQKILPSLVGQKNLYAFEEEPTIYDENYASYFMMLNTEGMIKQNLRFKLTLDQIRTERKLIKVIPRTVYY